MFHHGFERISEKKFDSTLHKFTNSKFSNPELLVSLFVHRKCILHSTPYIAVHIRGWDKKTCIYSKQDDISIRTTKGLLELQFYFSTFKF